MEKLGNSADVVKQDVMGLWVSCAVTVFQRERGRVEGGLAMTATTLVLSSGVVTCVCACVRICLGWYICQEQHQKVIIWGYLLISNTKSCL